MNHHSSTSALVHPADFSTYLESDRVHHPHESSSSTAEAVVGVDHHQQRLHPRRSSTKHHHHDVAVLPSSSSHCAPTTKSIPIAPSSCIQRTASEQQLQEDQAMADYRDYCMFSRIVHGIQHDQSHHSIETKAIDNGLIANLIRTRNSFDPRKNSFPSPFFKKNQLHAFGNNQLPANNAFVSLPGRPTTATMDSMAKQPSMEGLPSLQSSVASLDWNGVDLAGDSQGDEEEYDENDEDDQYIFPIDF